MQLAIRLLPFCTLDGATNMAADEVMLESAASGGMASLRFYGWTEPTLSLGYFQPSPDKTVHANLAKLPWVRRSTGGAGILHHHELTYSFALPSGLKWKSATSWICRFHHLVQDVLTEASVTSHLVLRGEERKLGEVLCFLHQTPGDLVVAGSKVAGSAQRKLRGSLLQHGSLLLRRSEFAPDLPGMHDLANRELFSPGVLAERLTNQFAGGVGATLLPGDWTSTEREQMLAICEEKYANPQWNSRR